MVCEVCGESFNKWNPSYSDPQQGPKYWKKFVDADKQTRTIAFCGPQCSLKWEQSSAISAPKK